MANQGAGVKMAQVVKADRRRQASSLHGRPPDVAEAVAGDRRPVLLSEHESELARLEALEVPGERLRDDVGQRDRALTVRCLRLAEPWG